MSKPLLFNYLAWTSPCLLLTAAACAAQAPIPEPITDQETELGQGGV